MSGPRTCEPHDTLCESGRVHTPCAHSRRDFPPPSAGEGGPRSGSGEGSDGAGYGAPLSRPSLTRGPPSPAEGGGKNAPFEHATVHATCVVVGEAGVLIRGESGAGKSSLALGLIERATLQGIFAALVGDDRVRLAAAHGRIVVRPHAAIAGLIEIRGHGLVAMDSVPACVLRLVVDLAAAGPRLPNSFADAATILGIVLPGLRIDRAARDAGLGPGLVVAKLLDASPGVSSQSHTPLPVCRNLPAP